jgi:hypothetical protein
MINQQVERIVVGAALMLGASVLLPIARKTISQAAIAGSKTVSGAISGIRSGLLVAKEELEDIVAEAQFERMKKQLDQEILE